MLVNLIVTVNAPKWNKPSAGNLHNIPVKAGIMRKNALFNLLLF
ncbi:MAG: hypothetical protein ACJARF_000817 [Alteromonadaceae bacterium]|jgi:hypothetical protein|tara:strand:+ start:5611 stop:5742 length:132 start_codon:yes stop_codon:yes gene_type:complete